MIKEKNRLYNPEIKQLLGYYTNDFSCDTPIPLRRRGIKRVTKLEEKIDIAYKAIIDRELHKDVAQEHRISINAVF